MTNDNHRGPFWDILEGRSPLPTASKLLGWKLISIDPAVGAIQVEFAATAEFVNSVGTIQGGIIAAMLDDTMTPAAAAYLGGNYIVPTLEMKISFMRPARVGPLFGKGRVLHRGRDILFLEGVMKDKEDKLIASATATARMYDWPKASNTK
jgi:uncharacterized protein (TIGR00369 family)